MLKAKKTTIAVLKYITLIFGAFVSVLLHLRHRKSMRPRML